MTFAGLPLGTLAAVYAAGAAALGALYVLKLRRRRVAVPFARLWARVLSERESSSLWRRLKRLLSLLVQLLLLGLIVMAAGDPRLGRGSSGRTIALVIDASASMRAVDEKPNRLTRAKEEARKLVAGLGVGDRALIIRLDGQPQALGGAESDDRELGRQIDSIAASDTPADLDRGLRVAADALRGQPRPTLILLGDGAGYQAVLDRSSRRCRSSGPASDVPAAACGLSTLDLSGIDVRFVPVGKSGDNVGIVGFAVRRYPQNRSSYEVFVEAQSFFDAAAGPASLRLELLQDGELVDVQHLDLKPGERVTRLYPNLAGAGARLEALLRPDPDRPGELDPFPLDDHAYALLPPRKKQRVLLVSSGNLFVEGALLLDENAVVERAPPSAWDPALAAGYDAVVLDGFTPPVPPTVPALYIDPSGAASPFSIAGTLVAPIITDVAEKHPLMRWVTLRDLNMTRSSRFTLAPGDVALASSARDPILVARESPRKTIALGFDVRKSDLPLRVGFPVLLVNALEWFAGDEAALETSWRTGRVWRIPASGAEAIVRDPDGESARVPVVDGRASYYGRKVGFHHILGATAPSGPERLLAASLADPEESAIKPARALSIDGRRLETPSGFDAGLRRELWALMVLAALALACAEWWTYNRRVTV